MQLFGYPSSALRKVKINSYRRLTENISNGQNKELGSISVILWGRPGNT